MGQEAWLVARKKSLSIPCRADLESRSSHSGTIAPEVSLTAIVPALHIHVVDMAGQKSYAKPARLQGNRVSPSSPQLPLPNVGQVAAIMPGAERRYCLPRGRRRNTCFSVGANKLFIN